MQNKRILISGAGIAGLTLAYWLKRYGFTPTIVEKYSTLRTGGYKIDIRGAAVEVVKRMGVHSAIYESRTDIQRSLFVDHSGKVVSEESPDLTGVRSEGDLEIVRGDLCEILYNRMGDVECIFGDFITDISQDEKGVKVEFERNEPLHFDLVIGAEGLHSTVRKLIFGEESRFLHKFDLYVSFYTIPNFIHLDRVEIEYHAPNRFAIVYSAGEEEKAIAGFVFSAKTSEFDYRNVNQQKKLLKKAFSEAGWEIPRLLKAIDEAPDFYFDCVAQTQMPHWTKGRVALAGDAGYAVSPISGQGASVALVGAYVLAGELALAKGDHIKAFSQYEECLRGFIKKNQDLAKMSAKIMAEKKNLLTWLSMQLFRLMPASAIRFFKKLGLKRTAKAAKLKFKDYPN